MKIVIIEDEVLTAEDLSGTITAADPDMEVVTILSSVREAVAWFRSSPLPDLIFSDIQLGDGLSFEIFKTLDLPVPVIFCTAYDEFALNAFKANGIDYILKPYSSATISDSIRKYQSLVKPQNKQISRIEGIIEALQREKQPRSTSILVYHKEKILPVRLDDIALFYIENEAVRLMMTDKRIFYLNKNLDELQQMAGRMFFRVNRQFLVNRKAIVEATQYFSRKLSLQLNVPFSGTVTVSKEKIPTFLKWLEDES